jgi:hypothetical protein
MLRRTAARTVRTVGRTAARAMASAPDTAHVRAAKRDADVGDDALRAGEITSRAEKVVWRAYQLKMPLRLKVVAWGQFARLNVRHSFIHGHVRAALTACAVWAAGSEFLHDFFHHHHTVHHLLGLVGTDHAVGFIALSHLSEHWREHLEAQDKPEHYVLERKRRDVFQIHAKELDPSWPRHIKAYHRRWARARRDDDLESFEEFKEEYLQRERRQAEDEAEKKERGGSLTSKLS